VLNLLPASEKRKQFELYALGLRDFAGVKDAQPLDPFALAEFAKLLVVDFEQIEGLSTESRQHLLGEGADQWSGGACSRPLPNGWKLVILNPAHGQQRNRATLMEEVAHVFLGHKPNRLAIINEPRSEVRDETTAKKTSAESRTSSAGRSRTMARDYNHDDEEAAYAVGAGALIPYAALRGFVRAGRRADQIARHFRVSRQLVEYRIKVTHLWPEYKGASKAGLEQV
jgi:uncharacterized protein DUF955